MSANKNPEDARLDFGAFGSVVVILLLGVVILAVAVAAVVDVSVWPLALVMVGALVLWTRWVC